MVYRPREVAEALRVSTVTVSRAIRDGKLKAFRVGGQWRILGSEVTNYLNRGTEGAMAGDDRPPISETDK
jgi:excisionase family DNA binding protein